MPSKWQSKPRCNKMLAGQCSEGAGRPRSELPPRELAAPKPTLGVFPVSVAC